MIIDLSEYRAYLHCLAQFGLKKRVYTFEQYLADAA